MKKTKSVRIDEGLYNQIDEVAKMTGFKTANFLGAILRQGLISVKENGFKIDEIEQKAPKIDVEFLQSEGEKAAKKGGVGLHIWLNSLSPQEENAIKYTIKGWRAAAKKADFEAELAHLPDLIKEGDRLSLRGTVEFMPWWDGLSKEIRAQLEHTHWPKWRFDKGRADNHIKAGVAPLGYSAYGNHLRQQGQSSGSIAADNAKDLVEIEAELERAKIGTLIE